MKINIVCLKWGTKYTSDYVNKLYNAVKRHTTLSFDFHCFTEDARDIDPKVHIHPLQTQSLDGWWNKMYLFSADLPVKGRIFYIDLDTLITGNIDHILRTDNGFVVLRDFFYGVASGVDVNAVGSGLMSYNSGQYDWLWQKFSKNHRQMIARAHPHGDQRVIQTEIHDFLYWQDLFPQQILSYKVHCGKGLPPSGKIICYHGKPSIPESFNTHTRVPHFDLPPQAWVKEHWH